MSSSNLFPSVLKVTYLGTTVLLVDDGQDSILFDCHVTRPSLFRVLLGKLQTNEAVADRVIADCEMDHLSAIFVSHTHHDHVMDVPYFARKLDAMVYGSASVRNVALGGGIPVDRILCYEDSMEYTIGNFKIIVLPSLHSPAHWYNNDLGQTIDEPLVQPARKRAYKEGGSFDFLLEHPQGRILIRPSCNFIPGQLNDIRADILFLGIGGLSGQTHEWKEQFYAETIDKVCPKVLVPIHWDNFFTPLYDKNKWMTGIIDDPRKSLDEVKALCEERGILFTLKLPFEALQYYRNGNID